MRIMQQWRLIPFACHDAAMNMAIDEMLIAQVASGQSLPTIRFYQWSKPTVSLGYFQRSQEVDRAMVASKGFELVRRLTGGRAVLHDRELTYSIVVPESTSGLPTQVNEAYRVLSEGIMEALRAIGLDAQMVKLSAEKRRVGETDSSPSSAACFDAPSWYELAVDGRKIVGSAQTRQKGVVLQHGSLLFDTHAESLADVLALQDAEKINVIQELTQKSAAINPLLREKGESETNANSLITHLISGFEHALCIQLAEIPLTQAEIAIAQQLAKEKYASDAWNFRR